MKKNKKLEHEAGIYFDDDYDYTQHIKDRTQEDGSVMEK